MDHIGCGMGANELGAHGGGMRKAGAIPAQVFTHADEPLWAMNSFKEGGMFDHDPEFFFQGWSMRHWGMAFPLLKAGAKSLDVLENPGVAE